MPTVISSRHRGWYWDNPNSELEVYVNGTKVLGTTASLLTITPATTITGALTASTTATITGNLTISSTVTAGSDGVGSDGEQLTSGGAAAECDWAAAASLRKFKDILGIRDDAEKVLDQIVNTPVYDFRYKRSKPGEHVVSTGDHDTVYTGIVAEDAPWAMHYKGKILNPISTFGYTVLALKALTARLKALEAAV